MRDTAIFWDIENYFEILGHPNSFVGRMEEILCGIHDLARTHRLRLCPAFSRAYARIRIRPRNKKLRLRNREILDKVLCDWSFMGVWSETIADTAIMNDIYNALQDESPVQFPPLFVLLSGDRDFVPALRDIQRSGREVWVIGSGARIHPSIPKLVDYYLPFADFIQNFAYPIPRVLQPKG